MNNDLTDILQNFGDNFNGYKTKRSFEMTIVAPFTDDTDVVNSQNVKWKQLVWFI